MFSVMINNVTIGITGASGHIGLHLTKYLSEKGFRVIAFVRNISSIKNVQARKYDLTETISPDLFSDVNILIHLAFVTRQQYAAAEQINLNGSKELFYAAKKQGVNKIIFFSSVTADVNAKSAYAKSKFEIGQLLQPATDLLVRCSMVIGTGGMFARMLTYARTNTFIPVLGSGKQIIQVVAIEDVVSFVEEAIAHNMSGSCVLANNEQLTYKQVFTTIGEVFHKRFYFIHVPMWSLKMTLRVCGFLHIRTVVSEENIVGMQSLRKYEPMAFASSFRTLRSKLEELHDSSLLFKTKITHSTSGHNVDNSA